LADAISTYNPNEQPQTEGVNHMHDLRLLSINQARKLLRIRHETMKGLIDAGRIGYIELEGRYKIPYQAIKKFISENTKVNSSVKTNDIEQDIRSIIFKK